jgi:hypothetical protein
MRQKFPISLIIGDARNSINMKLKRNVLSYQKA